MLRFAPLASVAVLATACLAAPSLAQAPVAFSDPANLTGERPAALTGRELPIDTGTRGLQQMLRRVSTRASLLLIVAHPDDEDGGMLTFVSRGLGGRAGILTLTRGEGGQNAMTADFEDALGLLRTQELLSADRYFGITQMFGTEVDFGFSKTKEEAFSKWTHDRVLYDAVRAVRIFRPLVIAAVFVGGVTDGHGQHQVSGEIAQEVFKAAGDPRVFPELEREGIYPWQPLKVYARVPRAAITPKGLYDYATNQFIPAQFKNYVSGEVSDKEPSTDVVIHEGATDPLLGNYPAKEPFVSYVQFARQGLGLQKSQIGPGERTARPGVYDVGYHRYGTMLPPARQKLVEDNFFDGIDTSFEGIATLAPSQAATLRPALGRISDQIHNATEHLNPEKPEIIAPLLANALQDTSALLARVEASNAPGMRDVAHELRVKRAQLNQATLLALGLSMEAAANQADLPANTTASAHVILRKLSAEEVEYQRGWSENTQRKGIGDGQGFDGRNSEGRSDTTVSPDRARECGLTAAQTPITRPYFTRPDIEQPFYNVSVPALRDAAQAPPAFACWSELTYRGVKLTMGAVVRHELQPVSFVPPASIMLSAHAQVVPNSERSFVVTLHQHPVSAPLQSLSLGAPGWTGSPLPASASAPGVTEFRIAPPARREPVTLRGEARLRDGSVITEGYRPVGYGDLPRTNFFQPATDRAVPVDLKLPAPDKRRIAYVPGTGDDVPAALTSIGLAPAVLTAADLTPARLEGFDTVILGVRTYNAHPELHGAATQALLDFARKGGNVVVQYQTAEFTAADAPYPLVLGGQAERVVDETDPVNLLDASSPLLTTPNRITPADFDGWVEERGHGFLVSWDEHYTALTEVHDPGSEAEHVLPEAPQRGGLITTPLGKGRWTYVAFAVYRQLPEAVPGAFRLFVNLLNP